MDRDAYINLIKQHLMTELKSRVIEVLVQKIPFLGLGFMSPIVGFLVGKLIGIILDTAEMGAFFLYTDLRVSQQGRKYLKAVTDHQAAMKGSNVQERIKSELALKDAFRDLIKFSS